MIGDLLGFTKCLDTIKAQHKKAMEFAHKYIIDLASEIVLSDETICAYIQGMGTYMFTDFNNNKIYSFQYMSNKTQLLVNTLNDFIHEYNGIRGGDSGVAEMSFIGYPIRLKRRPDLSHEIEIMEL